MLTEEVPSAKNWTVKYKPSAKELNEMYRDPICGMQVDPRTTAGTSEYKGTTYYFCSPGCKKTFDADPEKYAKRRHEHAETHGCC
jgi:Cu+-exporting ATPase